MVMVMVMVMEMVMVTFTIMKRVFLMMMVLRSFSAKKVLAEKCRIYIVYMIMLITMTICDDANGHFSPPKWDLSLR